MSSQWIDLRVDQIWNSYLEEDPPLVFGLTLAFLLHAHEEIETKRGEMILLRAPRQAGQWAWASTQLCLPLGHAAPLRSALITGQRAALFPAWWAHFFTLLALCSLSFTVHFYICICVPVKYQICL